MNKKIIFMLIVAACFSVYSCSDDILNTKPLDKYQEADIWSDVSFTEGFIYNTYQSVIPELFVNPGDLDTKSGGVSSEYFTDDILTPAKDNIASDLIDKYFDAGWATNCSYYFYGAAPLLKKNPIKQNSFEVIRDCNLIIQNVAASTGIPVKFKPGLIAQGKMLRALIYYTKARKFGKFVIVDKVLTQSDSLKLPRTNTIKETYDFIIKDLQDAAVDLPIASAAKTGQLTKGAAYAMLAEVALQGAAYIETGKSDYYQISKTASEELFKLGYTLDADYAGLFNDYNKALNSKELILTQFKHADATVCAMTLMQGLVPNMEVAKTTGKPALNESFLGWTKSYPSGDLVDDYLVTDADGVAKKWDATSYYADFKTNGGYVSKAVFNANRDKRFFASIVYDSTMLFTNLVTTRIGGNMHYAQSLKGTQYSTPSGFFSKKGIYNIIGYKAVVNTSYHQNVTRLGRAYLNYAEVMLRLNQPAIAIEYINKTRTTHGNLPALSTTLAIAEAWKWYKIERRVELYQENDRYWTLLRWGKEDGGNVISELNDKVYTYFEIAADGKSFKIKAIPFSPSNHVKKFSVKRYLFPVPENERLLNEKLDQNPGW